MNTNDEKIRMAKCVAIESDCGNPTVKWYIETVDGPFAETVREFGSLEELDMTLAVEGRKIGGLKSSVAYPVKEGTVQIDWFGIEEIGEGDPE